MATERTKGNKGVPRTELVAVRFDPKTKYLMEVAARTQRRSIANYVEFAVAESFKRTMVDSPEYESRTLESAASDLWDVNIGKRVAILANRFPHLMTYEEQQVVALVEPLLLALHILTFKSEQRRDAIDFVLPKIWTELSTAVDAGTGVHTIAINLDGEFVRVLRKLAKMWGAELLDE